MEKIYKVVDSIDGPVLWECIIRERGKHYVILGLRQPLGGLDALKSHDPWGQSTKRLDHDQAQYPTPKEAWRIFRRDAEAQADYDRKRAEYWQRMVDGCPKDQSDRAEPYGDDAGSLDDGQEHLLPAAKRDLVE